MADPTVAVAARSPETDAFAGAHARVVADPSIQFDLPQFAPPQIPGWLKPLLDALGAVAPLVEILFWAGAIAGAGVLLYMLVTRLLPTLWSRRGAGVEEPVPWRPDAGPARALLGEADELARLGRFAEAAHLLLWRSIEDIGARRPDLVQPALTSRDIARAEALPGGARAAFAQIARAVETSLFGRRPLDADTWAACRSAYAGFALDGRWE